MASLDVTVLVDRANAPRGLGGDQIALERNGAIVFAKGARWIDPTPALWQSAIIDALQDAGVSTARPRDGVSAAYEISADIQRFEADYAAGEDAAPTARVAVKVSLLDATSRNLIAAQRFSADARASANRMGSIVDAMNQASGQSLQAMRAWALDAIAQAESSRAEASR